MNISSKWLFSNDELKVTQNRKNGLSEHEELKQRYKSALLIQELGDKLSLDQLIINTGIVFMHRFYTLQPFEKFPYKTMAGACLMVSARILYRYRKVEDIARCALSVICRNNVLDASKKAQLLEEIIEDIIVDEEILLSAFGFDTTVDLPHSFILNACPLPPFPKELTHASYLFASASLFSTTMSVKYPPTIIACACIMAARKWIGNETISFDISEEWYKNIDPTITSEKLDELLDELTTSVNAFPTRFIKRTSTKPITSDSHSEVTNRLSTRPSSSFKTNPNPHRMPGNFAIARQEHQNGVALHNFNKTAVNATQQFRPIHNNSDRSIQDPHKIQQAKVMANAPSTLPAYNNVPQPFIKSEVDSKPVIIQGIPNTQNHVQSMSSNYNQHLVNKTPQPKSQDLIKECKAETEAVLPSTQINSFAPTSQPPKHLLLNDSQINPEVEDCTKDKKRRKHKKERKNPDDKPKKSKRSKETKEDNRVLAPIKIKISIPKFDPMANCNGIHDTDSSQSVGTTSEFSNDGPRVTLGKDVQGNFYQQSEDHSYLSESSSESLSRKRRHELSSSSSKRSRYEDGHLNSSLMFPPLSSEAVPPAIGLPQF